MSRMFKDEEGKTVLTVNPIKGGCGHECGYCYRKNNRAKRFYEGEPRFDDKALKNIGDNKVVFVCSMNDMFADWIPDEWIADILSWAANQSITNTFYFLTKNPVRYHECFVDFFHDDARFYFGATIESDIDAIVRKHTHAPPPSKRIEAMTELGGVKKFVSIEPIMEFSCSFAERIKGIEPEFVYVGYDNHYMNCPHLEPSLPSTRHLIEQMQRFTTVRLKTLREARA